MTRNARYVLSGLVIAFVIAAACAPAAAPSPAASVPAPAATTAASPVSAASPTPIARQAITGSYCAASAAMGLTWVTRDSGAFAKYGLDATLSFGETSQQIAGVTAGRITFGACTADAVVTAVLQGAKLKEIGLIVPTLQGQIWSVASVKSAQDLRGKVVGAWGPATNVVTYTMRYALQKLGLDPDKDVEWRKFNGTADLFAALASGQIQAAPVFVPDTLKAKQQGLYLLYDTPKDNVPYPSASIYVRSDLDPKVIEALSKAFAEGAFVYKTKPDVAIASIMKELQLTDQAVAAEAQRFFAASLADVPMWTDVYMKATLDALKVAGTDTKNAKPGDFYDSSYFQKLIDSGFIKQLWGK